MKVKNISGVDREIPTPDAVLFCAAGDVVEVDDELGASLVEQTDNWQAAKATSKETSK